METIQSLLTVSVHMYVCTSYDVVGMSLFCIVHFINSNPRDTNRAVFCLGAGRLVLSSWLLMPLFLKAILNILLSLLEISFV